MDTSLLAVYSSLKGVYDIGNCFTESKFCASLLGREEPASCLKSYTERLPIVFEFAVI